MPSPARRLPAAGGVPLAALLLVTLVGCGEQAPAPSEAPPLPPDALPGSPPEVEAALVTAEDLGGEWVDIGPVPLDDRGFDACPESALITGGEDPERLGEAQSTYAEGDPPAPIFGVSVSLWQSADVARARMASFASVPEACGTFVEEMPNGDSVTVDVTRRPAPELGDETIALEHHADPENGPSATLDVVLTRVGDALVLTESQRVDGEPDLSLDVARLDELTAEAVERVQTTLAASP